MRRMRRSIARKENGGFSPLFSSESRIFTKNSFAIRFFVRKLTRDHIRKILFERITNTKYVINAGN